MAPIKWLGGKTSTYLKINLPILRTPYLSNPVPLLKTLWNKITLNKSCLAQCPSQRVTTCSQEVESWKEAFTQSQTRKHIFIQSLSTKTSVTQNISYRSIYALHWRAEHQNTRLTSRKDDKEKHFIFEQLLVWRQVQSASFPVRTMLLRTESVYQTVYNLLEI